ncbi:hypothetical protein FB446DRAFT_771330 [Lentinula raphanica]|nr:hypothetical protein FB446DRAFT_771330 [Lentinula raphanica]
MSQNLRLNLKLRDRWFHAYMIVQFITNLRVTVPSRLKVQYTPLGSSPPLKVQTLSELYEGEEGSCLWSTSRERGVSRPRALIVRVREDSSTISIHRWFDSHWLSNLKWLKMAGATHPLIDARNLMQLTLKETLLPEGQFVYEFARYSDWDQFLKIVVHLFGCYDYKWGRIKNLGLIKIKKSKIGVVEAVYLESVYKLRDKGVITPSLYGKRALILERFDMVMSTMRSKKGFFLRKHHQPEELLRLTHTYPIASPTCAFDLRGVLQCYLARLWPQRTGGVCVLQAAENSEHGQSQKKKPFGINGGWLWA